MLQHALSTEADTPTRATRGHGSGIGDASLQLMQVFFLQLMRMLRTWGLKRWHGQLNRRIKRVLIRVNRWLAKRLILFGWRLAVAFFIASFLHFCSEYHGYHFIMKLHTRVYRSATYLTKKSDFLSKYVFQIYYSQGDPVEPCSKLKSTSDVNTTKKSTNWFGILHLMKSWFLSLF